MTETVAVQAISPLVDGNELPPNLVWYTRLDGKYLIEVHRKEGKTHEGVLHIFSLEGRIHLHSQDVGLSYGAQFGPDVADIEEWREICTTFADTRPS